MSTGIEIPSTKKGDIATQWGKDAWELLTKIEPPYSSKKRLTLLLLANYRLQGAPVTHVFKREEAASFQTHYGKWMKIPEYKAAYDHLMGMATETVEKKIEELEKDAVIQLETAIVNITRATSKAVKTLKDGLDAEIALTGFNPQTKQIEFVGKFPDNNARINAANSILDRVPDTAKNKKQEIRTPDMVKFIKEEDADLV